MKRYLLTAIKISFVVYAAVLFIILFVRHRGMWTDLSVWEYAMMQMNLIPFRTIGGYIAAIINRTMNLNIPLENLVGNLLMFLPMGIYLPLFSEKINNLKKIVLAMMPALLGIEIVQFMTKRGSFDIDDFILNLLGAVIGYLIWKSRLVQGLIEKLDNFR